MNNTPTSFRRGSPVRAVRAMIAGLLVVALAGCLKMEMNLAIDGDTVNGTVLAAVDRQTIQLFGMEPEEVLDAGDDDDFATLEGVTANSFEDDDWVGVEYVFDRVNLDDLNELAGDDEEMPRILHDAQAGTYEFLLTIDFTDWFGDDGLDNEDLGFPGLDPAALRDSFEVQIAVTFPGEVTEHNGELSGTTVSWSPQPGALTEMRAVALASGGDGVDAGGPAAGGGAPVPGMGTGGAVSTLVALLVALGVVVLVAAGGLIWWLSRRNAAPAVAAGAPAATVAAPGVAVAAPQATAAAPEPATEPPTDPDPTTPGPAAGTQS